MVPRPAELSQLLIDLGLTKPEADAYIQLLLLSNEGPATGYQVAKALGRDATAVYKALDELKRKGAVETAAGRGKLYRPVSPESLSRRLSRRYRRLSREASRQLSALSPAPSDEEVYRLHDRTQVFDRFRDLLRAAKQVALLDLSPRMYRRFHREIARAVMRGVSVVALLYDRPEADKRPACEVVVDEEGEMTLELMPGELLNGVFDCHSQVLAYLPRRAADEHVRFALWSANPMLAFQAHSGLASNLLHVATTKRLMAGEDADTILARRDRLARRIFGPVDWESFWSVTGERGEAPIEASLESSPYDCMKRDIEPGMIIDVQSNRPARHPSIQHELLERKRRIVDERRRHAQRDPDPDPED